jgi:hypothetical protein
MTDPPPGWVRRYRPTSCTDRPGRGPTLSRRRRGDTDACPCMCGSLAVERCPFRSVSDPLSRSIRRGKWRAQDIPRPCGEGHRERESVAILPRRVVQPACHERSPWRANTGAPGGCTTRGEGGTARWLARSCTPGEALRRRLKLVAAPSRSQSEPDSGKPLRDPWRGRRAGRFFRTPNLGA